MKLSLAQTKQLLERVEKKINLKEDAPINAYSRKGAPPEPTFGGLMAARDKERPAHRKKELARKAEEFVNNDRRAKENEKMPQDVYDVMVNIAHQEEVTEEELKMAVKAELKKLRLSSQDYSDIIALLQSYAKGVYGVSIT